MKKLISLVVLFTVLSATAANHRVATFLLQQSITVTNGLGFTNLSGTLSGVITTNTVGVIYTNLAGTKVVAAAADSTPCIGTVDLWPPYADVGYPLALQGQYTNQFALYTRITGQANATNADNTVTFVFCPVPDGVNEDTASARLITVTVIPNASTEQRTLTKLSMGELATSRSLRLWKVYTGSTTNASAASTVLQCTLIGWSP